MHDGRFKTLSEVIDHYSTGIKFHPNLGEELRQGNQPIKMQFSPEDKEALLAFFNTLTDDVFLQDERFSDPHK